MASKEGNAIVVQLFLADPRGNPGAKTNEVLEIAI
jgi:hypothetical protein